MIKNYFKTAWRNLRKGKAFAVINILGLSLGMTVAMFIGIWVRNEVSYNKDISNHGRIAKVMQNKTNNGEMSTNSATPYPLAEAMRKEYGSQFDEVVLATGQIAASLSLGTKKLMVDGGFFEGDIAKLLSLQILEGDSKFQEPNAILLAASTAKNLFGIGTAIGKMIMLSDSLPVKVVGVYKDIALNTDFSNTRFIAPWKLYLNNTEWVRTAPDPWRPNSFNTLVLIKENSAIDELSAMIKDIRLKHVNERLAKQNPQLFLYPMDRWYLRDQFKNGLNDGGRIQNVWMFAIIGAFVLLLACINFMNLSTARSVKRAKEVGIRKTVGSLRGQLVIQFFCESVLYTLLAFFISLGLIAVLMPLFNTIAGKLMPNIWNQPLFWLSGLLFCLLTGLLAGTYPAMYLSSFKPVKVLKGVFNAGKSAGMQRRVLVVVQFTISVVLIIGTIMVFKQIQFAKDRPVGYDKNGLISIEMSGPEAYAHFDAMKQELQNKGVFSDITLSSSLPTEIGSTTTGVDWPGKDPNAGAEFATANIGYDYGKTVGWEFAAGRDFSKVFASDSIGIIINEAAAEFMNLKNPVGTIITWEGHPLKIIGVIKNTINESPYGDARPAVFALDPENTGLLIGRINPKSTASAAVAVLNQVHKKFSQGQTFNYRFVDEEFNRKFGDEERMGRLGGTFALLAIFISCLGLFGMASFIAEQRVKEIGVRKVLGASIFSLWKLLSKDFIILVLVSILIAIPMGWYCMHQWLQNYSYRTPMPVWVFLAAALGAMAITLITISYQSIKSALANPSKALRSE